MKLHNCPCGSDASFQMCCNPFIIQAKLPETPEQLMRSRYSAYHNGAWQYLVETLHPTKRGANLLAQLARASEDTQWQSLRVKHHHIAKSGVQGSVEFVAFYLSEQHSASAVLQVHELSHFVKEDGVWFYVDGEMLAPVKIGRNDWCWCGSQKKFKLCHG